MEAHSYVIICLAVFVLFPLCFLSMAISSESKGIHRSMDREEIIRYFDVDHHDKVPEYEITVVERHRTRKSASEPQQIYRLWAFQRRLNLHLTPNEDLISPNLVIETRTKAGELTLERYNPRGVFYHGHVLNDPGSIVAVRDTDSNGELSGSIVSDGHLYKIEPLHLKRGPSKHSSGAHIISRRSLRSLRAKNMELFAQDSIKVPESLENDASTSRMHRRHARSGPLAPKYIEIMITADIFTTEFYGNATKDYVLGVANLVARLYRDPSMNTKVDVSFLLVKLYLINGPEPELNVSKHQVRSALKYMGLFSDFAKKRNPPVGKDFHWDNAVLLSRRICGLASCYLDGLAYFGVPCSSTAGVSINDAHSLGSAFSIAHELAHNFGVDHDYKNCQGGSIMASSQSLGVAAYHWSNCSVAQMESIMSSRRAKCYDNKPTNITEIPKVLPGYTWDGTQQCRFMYGKHHTLCWMTTHHCGILYCTTGNNCYGRGVPPAEGTRCGLRKWCIKGICVPDGTTGPRPVDGNWGKWKGYSPCSRSCGTGVQYMTRKCNDPAPSNGGKKCEGSSVGKYSTCNRWRCRYRENLPTFRDTQCASKKGYINPGSPCKVWCITNGVASSGYHPVTDGTRCSNDGDDYSVCVGGKCQFMGCDKRYGSEVVRDRCRLCDKDGSLCKPVNGSYTRNRAAFHEVFHVFPEGATNIHVWEDVATVNFINLKRAADKTFSNLFFRVNGGRVKKAAGTTIYYVFDGYNQIETLKMAGPLTEALSLVHVGYKSLNPGIHWKYYVPSLNSKLEATFRWRIKDAKDCSLSCAGGRRKRTVTCLRVESSGDKTRVSPKFCNFFKRPPSTVPCNTQKCPPVWQTVEWGTCSKRCGTGTQSRNVTCIQKVSASETINVPDVKCTASKPAVTQDCNVLDCVPTWVKGDWSACTKSCGGGTQNRAVTCKQVKKDGVIQSSDKCVADGKPPTQQQCNTKPC